jgi:hypothetical protein
MKKDDFHIDDLIKRALLQQNFGNLPPGFMARLNVKMAGRIVRQPARHVRRGMMKDAAYAMLTLIAGLCIGTVLQTNSSYAASQSHTNFMKYMMANYGGLL